jgi:ribosomal protein S18 acetylase RimI-like enzyme
MTRPASYDKETQRMATLRPMTEDEFEDFRRQETDAYAADRARNVGTDVAEEREEANRWFDEVLAEGLRTLNHHLRAVVDADDVARGSLWVDVNEQQQYAWILSREIKEEHRGQGYGRQAMELLEAELRPLGIKRIGLNVYADNMIARRLYEKVGYQITNYHMHKTL